MPCSSSSGPLGSGACGRWAAAPRARAGPPSGLVAWGSPCSSPRTMRPPTGRRCWRARARAMADGTTRILDGIDPLIERYDGFLLDQFGVLLDGVRALPG